MKKYKTLSTEIVNKNPWTEFRKDRYILPNGKEGDYFYLHTLGSAVIVPVTKDGKIVLNKQYRYLFQRESIELPSGGQKQGQSIEEAAKDELREESGFEAEKWKKIGVVAPANGVYDECSTVFLAWDLKEVGVSPDDSEEFEEVLMTPEELDEAIVSNKIWDSFAIYGWALSRPHVMKLIDQMKKKG